MAMFGRLWSIAAASIVCIVVLVTLNGLQHLRSSSPTAFPLDAKQESVEQFRAHTNRFTRSVSPSFSLSTTQSTALEATTSRSQTAALAAARLQSLLQTVVPDTHLDVKPLIPQPTFEPVSTDNQAVLTPTTSTGAPLEPTKISKIVVVGRLQTEDTDWVEQELSDWQNAIYYVDLPENITSPSGLRTKMNKAREAMPYLTYIIDNYPVFPDVVAFVHPHLTGFPKAWHNDARGHNAVNMLRDLRLDTVIERGYVNLRCNNEIGCPAEIQPFRDPPLAGKHAEHAFPHIYGHFFNATMEEMREQIPIVATQCCAQFAVSSAQLGKRPKEDYERYRAYLEETTYDDDTAGRVMEYMWHIIFGREAVACENVFECWCAVYGRCHHGARIWVRRWLGVDAR